MYSPLPAGLPKEATNRGDDNGLKKTLNAATMNDEL